MSQAPASDARRYNPPAARNREPILDVLRRHFPAAGLVFEVGCGTGEHVVHFAQHLPPGLIYQPTDPDPLGLASTDAWVAHYGLGNVRPAQTLDARSPAAGWPVDAGGAAAVIAINMIHVAPWGATEGLITGAARALHPNGLLVLYGPFMRGGTHMSPGNAAFDVELRGRDPGFGLRDLDAVAAVAHGAGFSAPTVEPMPANNLTVIFERTA